MLCPYCGKEMEKGYISAQNRLCWTPANETDRGHSLWSKSPNSIKLAEFYFVTAATVYADYCEDCNKIVIDLDN